MIDDKVTLERYGAHTISVKRFGAVCICSRLTVCENGCVADTEVT